MCAGNGEGGERRGIGVGWGGDGYRALFREALRTGVGARDGTEVCMCLRSPVQREVTPMGRGQLVVVRARCRRTGETMVGRMADGGGETSWSCCVAAVVAGTG
eukprot:scaffold932_cov97-Isochrysis_galbana.AAC.7